MKHTHYSKKSLIHPDTLLVAGLFLFVMILLTFILSYYGVAFPSSKKMACTTDARLCPDGTAVGRIAPRCEFASCALHTIPNRPGITEEPLIVPLETPPGKTGKNPDDIMWCTQEAKLCPDGSYVSRTGPKCEFSPCPNLILDNTSLPFEDNP